MSLLQTHCQPDGDVVDVDVEVDGVVDDDDDDDDDGVDHDKCISSFCPNRYFTLNSSQLTNSEKYQHLWKIG